MTVQDRIPKVLQPALRQYLHNDASGAVFGYDIETVNRLVAGLMPVTGDALHDNHAVDAFAAAVKAKMCASRDKGRGGWHKLEELPTETIFLHLAQHLFKGNDGTWEDIATYCLFAWFRSADPQGLPQIVAHEAAKHSRRYIADLIEQINDAERAEAAWRAVMEYVLGAGSMEEPMQFLRNWNEGNFDTLREEWPDAPKEIYLADCLANKES